MISNRLPTTTSRPMTKGLQRTTLKTANKRQLQDKSYWIGQLRSKMSDIQKETSKIIKENNIARQENESYMIYEKKAEEAAREISELQEKLAFQNLILEKLSISASIDDIADEIEARTADNEADQMTLDNTFEERRKREEECSWGRVRGLLKESFLYSQYLMKQVGALVTSSLTASGNSQSVH